MQSLTSEIRVVERQLETDTRQRSTDGGSLVTRKLRAMEGQTSSLPSPPANPAFSLSRALTWISAKAISVDQATWPNLVSDRLPKIAPPFSFDDIKTYVGINGRLCWPLIRFHSGTLATADHRSAEPGSIVAECACGRIATTSFLSAPLLVKNEDACIVP